MLSQRGSTAIVVSVPSSVGTSISMYSPGQMTVVGEDERKTCGLAARILWSFVVMNGIPARMSTSKSSTTRASRASFISERARHTCTSPITAKGVVPSACNAFCEDFSTLSPNERAREALTMLVSAPVSRVNFTGCCL